MATDQGPEPRRGPRLSRSARLTADVHSIIQELESFLNSRDDADRVVCAARCGVYAFYDYDGEPIYVGQTYESLRVRIRRHLTNQRTDAVAMHVLDPMEVARVEVWPLWELEGISGEERQRVLNSAEFTLFQRLSEKARVSKLLNEKAPALTDSIDLPRSFAADIVPPGIRERLSHPDERISRRASTIANLSQVVRERDVSLGLRETLVTQAERLEHLAKRRLEQVLGETPPEQVAEEVRREEAES